MEGGSQGSHRLLLVAPSGLHYTEGCLVFYLINQAISFWHDRWLDCLPANNSFWLLIARFCIEIAHTCCEGGGGGGSVSSTKAKMKAPCVDHEKAVDALAADL